MPTPVELMRRYRNLKVNATIEEPRTRTCREGTYMVQLRQYFMMDWDEGSEEYSARKAVNDPAAIEQGDVLVWMRGNSVMRRPGHVAAVESYAAQSRAGGNMRVVGATGAAGAKPKLLDSNYTVERVLEKDSDVPVMILVVKRHGRSGSRVAVMRPYRRGPRGEARDRHSRRWPKVSVQRDAPGGSLHR